MLGSSEIGYGLDMVDVDEGERLRSRNNGGNSFGIELACLCLLLGQLETRYILREKRQKDCGSHWFEIKHFSSVDLLRLKNRRIDR